MRLLLAVFLFTGCYKPSTDSCYYACATEGAGCPSGLTCVAGMCAAPGDDCSATGGDGGIDAPDAPAACGDGIAVVGEVCFGIPIPFTPIGTPSFAQLADAEGDGDVDLIYVDDANYQIHVNTGGVLATGAIQVLAAANVFAMITATIDANPGVELLHIRIGELRGYSPTGAGQYAQLFLRTISQGGSVAMAFGRISASPIGDLAVVIGNSVLTYRFDSPNMPTQGGPYPISGGRRIALASIDADTFEDVVVATDTGIEVFLALNGTLGNSIQVGPTARIENVVTGDFDADGNDDIVFSTISATLGTGTIQLLAGRGNATFQDAVSVQLPSLGSALAVADVDRDGRDDVIAFQGGNPAGVVILRGKGDRTLDAPIKLMVTGTASQLSATGDFNDDKIPDIVVTDTVGRRVAVIPSMP